jgi:NADH dehydrogenase
METHVVTGAYGYSGKYIATRLLAQGKQVHTLTNSTYRANPFGDRITASSYHFADPQKLVAFLEGTSVLYNTYWVRFDHRDFTYRTAVENTISLFAAAKKAGVRRIVHISITNPSLDSELEYFSGKAQLEQELMNSGISYAILRPTVLFGEEDILINNIAWVLRRMPIFGVFGDGNYRLQPIYVGDLAKIAVQEGRGEGKVIIDAIGPETFTFRELVGEIADIIGVRRAIISVPPELGYLVGSLLGKFVGDVFLTREEIAGLMQNLLYTTSLPVGETRLTLWAGEHADTLGLRYSSELARRRNRKLDYKNL